VPALGRLLILAGALLIIVGVALLVAPRIPWLGRLPGDLRIERPRFRLYFPLATSLLVSVVLTILLNLFARRR
jgi:hypothetical protein